MRGVRGRESTGRGGDREREDKRHEGWVRRKMISSLVGSSLGRISSHLAAGPTHLYWTNHIQ